MIVTCQSPRPTVRLPRSHRSPSCEAAEHQQRCTSGFLDLSHREFSCATISEPFSIGRRSLDCISHRPKPSLTHRPKLSTGSHLSILRTGLGNTSPAQTSTRTPNLSTDTHPLSAHAPLIDHLVAVDRDQSSPRDTAPGLWKSRQASTLRRTDIDT